MDSALANLEGDVENFDTDNWRGVVPQVKAVTDELRDALDSLKRTFGYPS
jgi:hypothetical protein